MPAKKIKTMIFQKYQKCTRTQILGQMISHSLNKLDPSGFAYDFAFWQNKWSLEIFQNVLWEMSFKNDKIYHFMEGDSQNTKIKKRKTRVDWRTHNNCHVYCNKHETNSCFLRYLSWFLQWTRKLEIAWYLMWAPHNVEQDCSAIHREKQVLWNIIANFRVYCEKHKNQKSSFGNKKTTIPIT